MPKRVKELLISARVQLGATLEGIDHVREQSEIGQTVLRLMGEIEQLLGY